MTEQEKIEQAAENFSRNHNFAQDRTLLEDGFEAGASFYAKEVMPGIMVEFAEWVGWNYEQSLSGDKWLERGKNPIKYYTTKQLLEKFFEQSKQKDNEQGNKVSR